ncbi:MAG: hypothetical protein IJ593_10845, partial [Lachnospiraceae bacterium]|nr:hypothetical protein [Lachnospiraceae bacterium]
DNNDSDIHGNGKTAGDSGTLGTCTWHSKNFGYRIYLIDDECKIVSTIVDFVNLEDTLGLYSTELHVDTKLDTNPIFCETTKIPEKFYELRNNNHAISDEFYTKYQGSFDAFYRIVSQQKVISSNKFTTSTFPLPIVSNTKVVDKNGNHPSVGNGNEVKQWMLGNASSIQTLSVGVPSAPSPINYTNSETIQIKDSKTSYLDTVNGLDKNLYYTLNKEFIEVISSTITECLKRGDKTYSGASSEAYNAITDKYNKLNRIYTDSAALEESYGAAYDNIDSYLLPYKNMFPSDANVTEFNRVMDSINYKIAQYSNSNNSSEGFAKSIKTEIESIYIDTLLLTSKQCSILERAKQNASSTITVRYNIRKNSQNKNKNTPNKMVDLAKNESLSIFAYADNSDETNSGKMSIANLVTLLNLTSDSGDYIFKFTNGCPEYYAEENIAKVYNESLGIVDRKVSVTAQIHGYRVVVEPIWWFMPERADHSTYGKIILTTPTGYGKWQTYNRKPEVNGWTDQDYDVGYGGNLQPFLVNVAEYSLYLGEGDELYDKTTNTVVVYNGPLYEYYPSAPKLNNKVTGNPYLGYAMHWYYFDEVKLDNVTTLDPSKIPTDKPNETPKHPAPSVVTKQEQKYNIVKSYYYIDTNGVTQFEKSFITRDEPGEILVQDEPSYKVVSYFTDKKDVYAENKNYDDMIIECKPNEDKMKFIDSSVPGFFERDYKDESGILTIGVARFGDMTKSTAERNELDIDDETGTTLYVKLLREMNIDTHTWDNDNHPDGTPGEAPLPPSDATSDIKKYTIVKVYETENGSYDYTADYIKVRKNTVGLITIEDEPQYRLVEWAYGENYIPTEVMTYSEVLSHLDYGELIKDEPNINLMNTSFNNWKTEKPVNINRVGYEDGTTLYVRLVKKLGTHTWDSENYPGGDPGPAPDPDPNNKLTSQQLKYRIVKVYDTVDPSTDVYTTDVIYTREPTVSSIIIEDEPEYRLTGYAWQVGNSNYTEYNGTRESWDTVTAHANSRVTVTEADRGLEFSYYSKSVNLRNASSTEPVTLYVRLSKTNTTSIAYSDLTQSQLIKVINSDNPDLAFDIDKLIISTPAATSGTDDHGDYEFHSCPGGTAENKCIHEEIGWHWWTTGSHDYYDYGRDESANNSITLDINVNTRDANETEVNESKSNSDFFGILKKLNVTNRINTNVKVLKFDHKISGNSADTWELKIPDSLDYITTVSRDKAN